MQTLIIGCGAVGGLIGARLIENGGNVTFLVGSSRQRQLLPSGLLLMSPYGRFRRPVAAVTATELSGTYDLVIAATRAHKIETALGLTAMAVGPETIVLTVAEGFGHIAKPVAMNGPRLLHAVLEARMTQDADGVLSQRPPFAELKIGDTGPFGFTTTFGGAPLYTPSPNSTYRTFPSTAVLVGP